MKSLGRRLRAEIMNGNQSTIGKEKQSLLVPQINAILNSSLKSLGRWLSAEMMIILPQIRAIMNSSMKSLGR
jgi:hypothetical protein